MAMCLERCRSRFAKGAVLDNPRMLASLIQLLSCLKSSFDEPALIRHSQSFRNSWKWYFGTPLNFRRCRLTWFQKTSMPLILAYEPSNLKKVTGTQRQQGAWDRVS